MLRDLNVSSGGRRICGTPQVGVLASAIPTGFALPSFLLNDIDSGFPNRLYSIEILTLPSSGTLYVDEVSSATFTGAPDGTYSGTQRVEKFDAGVGKVSSVTGAYTLAVGATADTTVPTMTGSLSSSAITTSGFTLSWSAGADNIAVTGYEVSIDGGTTYTNVGNVQTISETSLASGTVYATKVRAFDAAGNRSTPLSLSVSTAAQPDSVAPTMVGSIVVSAITTSGFTLAWPAASDNVAVTGYEYSTDNGATYSNIGNVLSYTCSGMAASTLYYVKVRAFDVMGNKSAPLTASVTTATVVVADTTIPTMSGVITATSVTTGGFTLSWSAGSDNIGVGGYEISIDTGTPSYTQLGNVLTYTKTGLLSGTTYTVRIRDYDAAGNRGAAITASVSTTAAGLLATTVTLTFTDRSNQPRANLTGMKWSFFDQATPDALGTPSAHGVSATTNYAGVTVINISGTTLAPGAIGWLVFSNSDGTTTQSNLISFAGPVVVA